MWQLRSARPFTTVDDLSLFISGSVPTRDRYCTCTLYLYRHDHCSVNLRAIWPRLRRTTYRWAPIHAILAHHREDRGQCGMMRVSHVIHYGEVHPARCGIWSRLSFPLLSIAFLARTPTLPCKLSPTPTHCRSFAVYVTMAAGSNGHRPSGSVSQAQNHKAQLVNAYNELGKELSSQKIRVLGNYTLGNVIG